MKYLYMALGTVATAILTIGLISVQSGQAETFSAPQTSLPTSASQIQTVEIGGDLSHEYQSVQELAHDAELIVHIKAESSNSFQFHRVAFTVSNATVQKVFKGSNDSKTINILETGGVIGNVKYVFEESPVLTTGDEAVLFLKKYTGPVTTDAYTILGAYQGKFNVKGNTLTAQKETHKNLGKVHSLQDLGL